MAKLLAKKAASSGLERTLAGANTCYVLCFLGDVLNVVDVDVYVFCRDVTTVETVNESSKRAEQLLSL